MDYLIKSLDAVQSWVEGHNYQGYDPGDGLTSFLRPLTFGNHFAERLLQQAIWKSPVNLRPLVGVVPLDSTKGRGFMAAGYLLRHASTGADTYRDKAVACLRWLEEARERGHVGHCWGNHFDFSTRSGRIRAHTPTIVWTSLIGHAFIDGYERLNDASFLDVAESICRWILTLPREQTRDGACLSYTGVFQNSVHNSSLLGAGMLARTWRYRERDEYRRVALQAAHYSCNRQLADGSWWYAEEPKYRWIDNFHTAYNLESLRHLLEGTAEKCFRSHLDRGYAFFKRTFFDPSGRPRYYHNRAFPIDIQCAAQAIETFCTFADSDPEALSLARRVANWTIENMQDSDGHFYYRRYPMMTAKTAYFHWGQATMFKALAKLVYTLDHTTRAHQEAETVPLRT